MKIIPNCAAIAVAATLLIAALSISGAAWAQASSEDQPRQTDDTSQITQPRPSRVVTPRRSDREAPGEAIAKSSGRVNWAEVRNLLDETQLRDREYNRLDTTQAIRTNRPPIDQRAGLRSVPAEQLQSSQTALAQEVRRTGVPVIVPVIPQTLGGVRVFTNNNAYTAIIELENNARVEFIGTRMRVITNNSRITKDRLAQRRRMQEKLAGLNANYIVSKHEQGIDLSFSKFNVAYMVSIYCQAPDTDTRCTDENYITSLASNVALLNEAEGGAQ